MDLEVTYPHILKTPGEPARLSQHPRTRVAMIIADYLYRGWSAEQIALNYPYLNLAEVHAAFTYYFDHKIEIDAELAAENVQVKAWKESHPTSPLLTRLKERGMG